MHQSHPSALIHEEEFVGDERLPLALHHVCVRCDTFHKTVLDDIRRDWARGEPPQCSPPSIMEHDFQAKHCVKERNHGQFE